MKDILKLHFNNGNTVSLVETSKTEYSSYGFSRIKTYRMFFLIGGSMSFSEVRDFSTIDEALHVFNSIMQKAQQDNIANELIDYRDNTIINLRTKTIRKFN